MCDDIAKRLGTIGYMKELNRIKVGRFSINDAITIEELEKNTENIKDKVISIETLFKDLPIIKLQESEYKRFLNGVCIFKEKENGIYNIYEENYIGLGIVKDKRLKRDIII